MFQGGLFDDMMDIEQDPYCYNNTLDIDDPYLYYPTKESPASEYFTYSHESLTPDIIYINNEYIDTVEEDDNKQSYALSIPDLVKSRSRGAKNKAQQSINEINKTENIKSEYEHEYKQIKIEKKAKTTKLIKPSKALKLLKPEKPTVKARVKKMPDGRIIPHVKRGVKIVKSEPADAELACHSCDATPLRRHCEYLYDYFDEHHVAGNLPIETYIRKVFDVVLTYTQFKMLIRLTTGILIVDFLCDNPYIEVACKCGTFHKYTSDLITK